MKTLRILIESLIVIFLLVAIYLLYQNWKKDPIPTNHYDYSTLTVNQKIPYPLPNPLKVKTPPRIITKYEIDSSAIDSLKILLSEKEIVIKGLVEEIRIHENFLKQFPKNPKLVELNLSHDSLSLSLLEISGFVNRYDYPIFLERYKYRWLYNDLTHQDIPQIPEQKEWYLNYYVIGAYNFFPKSPYIGVQANFEKSRIRFTGEYGLLLLNEKPNYFRLSVGYKLFKNE